LILKTRTHAITALLLAAGLAPALAQAGPTAYDCHGCSEAQEDQTALAAPGLGVRFIYNLTAQHIRKFYVSIDYPNNTPEPTDPKKRVISRTAVKPGDPTLTGVKPGAVRTLSEMNVDTGVQQIFNTLQTLDTAHASVLSGGEVTVDISALGLTSGDLGPRSFDPRQVAWDYPDGEAARFLDRINARLGSQVNANAISTDLSTFIYGIFLAIQSVYVEGGLEGGNLSGLVGLTFANIPPNVTLKLCDAEGNCAYVKLTPVTGGTAITFEGTRDPADVYYPNQNGTWPLYKTWQSGHFREARDYATWISGHTGGRVDILSGSTGQCPTRLACVQVGEYITCTLFCIP
jgi:hypothetical protein